MNVGFLVGHNSVRKKVMNLDNRPPTSRVKSNENNCFSGNE